MSCRECGSEVPSDAVACPTCGAGAPRFIPMSLNAPLVVGGLVAWFVSNRSKDEALNKARFDRGTLIASGFIAGGALMGVLTATLKFMDVQWEMTAWKESDAAQYVALAVYVVLIAYMTIHTLRAKKE